VSKVLVEKTSGHDAIPFKYLKGGPATLTRLIFLCNNNREATAPIRLQVPPSIARVKLEQDAADG
jgi:hypothetical protein